MPDALRSGFIGAREQKRNWKQGKQSEFCCHAHLTGTRHAVISYHKNRGALERRPDVSSLVEWRRRRDLPPVGRSDCPLPGLPEPFRKPQLAAVAYSSS